MSDELLTLPTTNLPRWPNCGAAGCVKPATMVDACGIGWCGSCGGLSLVGGQKRADSTDDFDPEWLAGIGSDKLAHGRHVAGLEVPRG